MSMQSPAGDKSPISFEPTLSAASAAAVPSSTFEESPESLAARASLQPGCIVAEKYQIDRAIATGGMGLVCLATHLVLGEPVILKFVRPDLADNDEAVERLLVEARLAAKLRGEHFARIHDAGRLSDGVPYVAMEYLKGRTLAEELEARGGVLTEAEATLWIEQACKALHECHEIGIVHRDVKPENLFIADTPQGERILKLIDFGISKHIHRNRAERSITNPGESLGSPLYMAPEQMRTPHLVDRRADIWSLGVVLYLLISGRHPFDGDTIAEVCAQVLCETPVPLSDSAAGVAPELSRIVARCLERDPEHRFASAAELRDALQFGQDAVNVVVDMAPGTAAATSEARAIKAETHDSETVESAAAPMSDWDVSSAITHIPGERRWGPAFLGAAMVAAALTSFLVLVPSARAGVMRAASPFVSGWLTPAALDPSIPSSPSSFTAHEVRPAMARLSALAAEPERPLRIGEKPGVAEPGSPAKELEPAPAKELAPAPAKELAPIARELAPVSKQAAPASKEPTLTAEDIAARKARYQEYLDDNGLTPVEKALEEVESDTKSDGNPY